MTIFWDGYNVGYNYKYSYFELFSFGKSFIRLLFIIQYAPNQIKCSI